MSSLFEVLRINRNVLLCIAGASNSLLRRCHLIALLLEDHVQELRHERFYLFQHKSYQQCHLRGGQ